MRYQSAFHRRIIRPTLFAVSVFAALAAMAGSPRSAPASPSASAGSARMAQPEGSQSNTNSVRDKYSKFETYIPMRDGVRLYTVIFVPKDSSKTYPILMERTPYGVPYGADNFPRTLGPSDQITQSGYIVAYQDVRGTHMSEGEFVNIRPELPREHRPTDIDESTDCYDTVDWLVHSLPTNNGRVGLWGISYPGFYADAGAINAHSAVKAVSPQAPLTDWFLGDDEHHNGAFYMMDNFAWEYGFDFDYPRAALTQGYPQPHHEFPINDGYKFYLDLGPLKNADDNYLHKTVPYWNELMVHGNYDSYWEARNLRPHLVDVKPAMLATGGLFDAEDYAGTIATYERLISQSPKTMSYLALGPWPHGGWARGTGEKFGAVDYGSATGAYYREQIEFPFFEYYLKGVGAPPASKVNIFATGSDTWMSFDAWPPKNLTKRSLYFGANQTLSFTKMQTKATAGDGATAASDSYVSDPANPVPYSSHAHTQSSRYTPYMTEDQRFLADRTDVLSYKSAPVDADMTVAGPVTADLFVSTTGTDADFVVKVIDVYPDDPTIAAELRGAQILVRADVMRAKFRNRFDKPEPLKPGEVSPVRFDLPDVCHSFRKGHRILVQVQSSWFPIVDRNPQKFVDIYSADAADFQKATIHLYRSDAYPSRIVFGTL